jgi:diacylglycerol kinase
MLATVFVLGLALWCRLSSGEIAILLLSIGLVWTAEFVNTALEAVVDLASPEIHPLARVGKDVGAAAVLIAALLSILIGILILGPPIAERLGWVQ